MKNYTNLEQSRKLADILPIESADMCYRPYREEGGIPDYQVSLCPYQLASWIGVPCWSLGALLEQFEDTAGLAKDYGLWFCYYNRKSYCTKHYDNPVDACVEMIVKLHEQKLL